MVPIAKTYGLYIPPLEKQGYLAAEIGLFNHLQTIDTLAYAKFCHFSMRILRFSQICGISHVFR